MPLTFGPFSVWVEVDGSEIPVFDAQEKNTEVTGWIPSETGKPFSVKLSVGQRERSMAADIYIDGQSFSGRPLYAGPALSTTISGVATSDTTEKPFVFSPLELTDDDDYLQKATVGLGDIKLVLSYATIGAASHNYQKYDSVGKVHEKSKKALGHKVDLGQEKPKERSGMVAATRHAVIASFVFKYRPIDMLRANGIAPPAPIEESKKRAASPTDNSDHVLDLTANSDDEDERRIKALRDELAGLERKRRKTTRVKREPGVKREGSSSMGRSGRTASLGVVDLT